jgi:pimeloyl-ACP methyl ester carboxylesterase
MEDPSIHPFRSAEAKQLYLSTYDKRAEMWPVQSENRTVGTFYGPTFVRISGEEDAPSLVLLPGASSNSLLWAPNIAALSETYRTFAVDNIYDYGRSVYTMPLKQPLDFVYWLDELFTKLGLQDGIRLMGLSYGGWLTSQYALHHPERLAKIVMLAPAHTVLSVRFEFYVRALLCLLPSTRFNRSFMFWLLEDWAKKDAESRRMAIESADDMALAARCFKAKGMVVSTVLSDSEWQSLKVPTLYMVGEHEKIYDAHKALERLQQAAPQVKTELIPGAGHDLSIVQAELVTSKVLEFLKD